MARRIGRRRAPDRNDAQPRSPFRWPSRSRADEAERAARRAANAGLERLRARTPRPSPAPGQNSNEPAAVRPDEPPDPTPWDAKLDELTERLVAELRRDLGPEP